MDVKGTREEHAILLTWGSDTDPELPNWLLSFYFFLLLDFEEL